MGFFSSLDLSLGLLLLDVKLVVFFFLFWYGGGLLDLGLLAVFFAAHYKKVWSFYAC